MPAPSKMPSDGEPNIALRDQNLDITELEENSAVCKNRHVPEPLVSHFYSQLEAPSYLIMLDSMPL